MILSYPMLKKCIYARYVFTTSLSMIAIVWTEVSCPSCFLYTFYRAASVLRTSCSTLRYTFARVHVLRAHYAMFVSCYSAQQKAYKTQLVQETIFHTFNVVFKGWVTQHTYRHTIQNNKQRNKLKTSFCGKMWIFILLGVYMLLRKVIP